MFKQNSISPFHQQQQLLKIFLFQPEASPASSELPPCPPTPRPPLSAPGCDVTVGSVKSFFLGLASSLAPHLDLKDGLGQSLTLLSSGPWACGLPGRAAAQSTPSKLPPRSHGTIPGAPHFSVGSSEQTALEAPGLGMKHFGQSIMDPKCGHPEQTYTAPNLHTARCAHTWHLPRSGPPSVSTRVLSPPAPPFPGLSCVTCHASMSCPLRWL